MFNGESSHKYRSRMEIIYDILQRINESGTILKTHILYGANLNSRSLEKFLNQLIRANLIAKISSRNGKTYYTLTLRGRALLNYMRRIYTLLSDSSSILSFELGSTLRAVAATKRISVLRNYGVKGASGNIHTYYTYLKADSIERGIAVHIVDLEASIEDMLHDFSAFALSLVDTSSHGIFMVPEHHYEPAIRFYKAVFERNHSTLCTVSAPSMVIEYYNALDSYRNIIEKILRITVSRTVR